MVSTRFLSVSEEKGPLLLQGIGITARVPNAVDPVKRSPWLEEPEWPYCDHWSTAGW